VSFTARARRLQPQWLARTLEGEYEALSGDGRPPGRRLAALQTRLSIAQLLANLCRSAGAKPQSEAWAATARRLAPEVEALLNAT